MAFDPAIISYTRPAQTVDITSNISMEPIIMSSQSSAVTETVLTRSVADETRELSPIAMVASSSSTGDVRPKTTPTPRLTNQSRPVPQPTNQSKPVPQTTSQSKPLPQPTNQSKPLPQPTNQSKPVPQLTNQSKPVPQPTNQSKPVPQPTNQSLFLEEINMSEIDPQDTIQSWSKIGEL